MMLYQTLTLDQFVQQYWWVLALIFLWTIPWKGYALWKAARNGQAKWFIALLVINTVGILEITYVFYFSKPKQDQGNNVDSSMMS